MDNKNLIKPMDKTEKVLLFVMIYLVLSVVCFLWLHFALYSKTVFSDMAETLSYCIIDNPYSGEYGIRSIYPPFAYLPFYLFALIAYKPLTQYEQGVISLFQLNKEPAFLVSFILFYIICLGLIMFLSAKLSGFKGKKLVYLLISIACFGPILHCFCRGNNIISCLVFVMLFFWLYNSGKRWHKEIANLCLACAIAIKIYPILIVLFFIKDRRFMDLLKTIGYSLFLIFIPFLLIDGGFGNLSHIWNNFTVFNTGQERQLDTVNISLDAFASWFSILLGLGQTAFYPILSKVLRFGLVLTTIITFAVCGKSKLKMQVILCALLTYEMFMGVSYAYTLIFLIIPIIEYFKEYENISKINKWYYGICFLIISFPLFAGLKEFTGVRIVLIALVVKAVADIILDEIKQRKKIKEVV